jgi:DNA polymerase I-like protein with 3'-5' exonuclease and polymerase domains
MVLAMIVIYRKYKAMGFKSLVVGQVHDALIFDCKKEEIKKLAEMCIEVFDDLPNLIEQTFGFDFNVPLTGDAEYGNSWGELNELKLAA